MCCSITTFKESFRTKNSGIEITQNKQITGENGNNLSIRHNPNPQQEQGQTHFASKYEHDILLFIHYDVL